MEMAGDLKCPKRLKLAGNSQKGVVQLVYPDQFFVTRGRAIYQSEPAD
jgi:hypothetical protein